MQQYFKSGYNTWPIWFIAALLCGVPLVFPIVPPLIDLPGHMASYHISLNLDNSPQLSKYYSYDWKLMGNTGVDLLIIPLGKILGVELAAKWIMVAIPVMTALSFIAVSRQAHGRYDVSVLYAFPLAYSYPFIFGFVNYAFSVALAFAAFALWLRWHIDKHSILRLVIFVVISLVLWISHAIGWVIMCLMCGAAELYKQYDKAGTVNVTVLTRTSLACLPLLAPLAIMLTHRGVGGEGMLVWKGFFDLFKILMTSLRDRWAYFDLLSVLLILSVILLSITRLFGLRLEPRLAWPAGLLFIAFMFLPFGVDGSAFVNTRIAPFALALAIISIKSDHLDTKKFLVFVAVGLAFFVTRIAAHTASMAMYDKDYKQKMESISYIPEGSAVITFSAENCGNVLSLWTHPRLDHLSGVAVIRKNIFINSLWEVKGLHSLSIKYQSQPFVSSPSNMVSLPECTNKNFPLFSEQMDKIPPEVFDYVWLIGIPRKEWPQKDWMTIVWERDDVMLAKIDKRTAE